MEQAYTFNVAYGVGKAATDRLVNDMHVQLHPLGVDTVLHVDSVH
jgi:hypothetical protein